LVETEDGYIIEMHRIPHGKCIAGEPLAGESRIPVILMHGNFQSSADWVLNADRSNSFGTLDILKFWLKKVK